MTFQAGIFGLEFWPVFQAGIFGLFFTGQNSRPKFSGQNFKPKFSTSLFICKHFCTYVPLQTNKIQLRNHKFIFLQCQMLIGFLPSKSISFFLQQFCLTFWLGILAWNSRPKFSACFFRPEFQAEISAWRQKFWPGQKFRPADVLPPNTKLTDFKCN